MVNFQKLKTLINETEKMSNPEQRVFYQRLKDIAEIELNIRQSGLSEYFG